MITLKELNFINTWAKKAPYPGTQYAEKVAEKLIDSVNIFEQVYKDKEYDLVLSNGEQLSFEILSMNLCHMLGIDYKNLTSGHFNAFLNDILEIDSSPRSYELLNAIVGNISRVLDYDKDHSGIILNYYRVMVKCSIFEKLSDFNKFNFGVINFDKATFKDASNNVFRGNSEKILYVQSNEQACPYFMMGILPSSEKKIEEFDTEDAVEERKFAVESLLAPANPRDFFCNQTVTIPTQILTTTIDTMDKVEATPSQRIALLNQYRAIISEYNIPNKMDIYGDYMSILSNSEAETRPTLVKK